MRNPEELQVFGLADRLVEEVYRLTADFPVGERYGLTQQIRRAAVSVPSNIVEGCSRNSQADFARFIEIATGSAMELRYQLALARRMDFGASRGFTADIDPLWCEVTAIAESLGKALIALGKSLRAQTPNPKP